MFPFDSFDDFLAQFPLPVCLIPVDVDCPLPGGFIVEELPNAVEFRGGGYVVLDPVFDPVPLYRPAYVLAHKSDLSLVRGPRALYV